MYYELLRRVFADPSLLDQVDPEWLRNGSSDKMAVAEIIQTMIELKKRGVDPTPQNVADQDPEDPASVKTFIEDAIESDSDLGWSYIMAYVKEEYASSIDFNVGNKVIEMVSTGQSHSAVEQFINEEFRKVPSINSGRNMISVTDDAYDRLQKIYAGEIASSWTTGKKKIDEAISWGPKNIDLVVALQKSGKSRVVYEIGLELLRRQSNLKMHWFNFEMSDFEMIACGIANITGIETRTIMGKGGRRPTDEQIKEIKAAKELIRDMNIHFHSGQMRISDIRRIAAKVADDETVMVIDNWGLVAQEPGMTDNQHDDHMAKELVYIRDAFGPLIIPIHHLSKESTSHFNKENDYEPEVRHIRGSARIADYADNVVLLHRAEMFAEQLEGKYSEEEFAKIRGHMLFKLARGRNEDATRINLTHKLGICKVIERD